jgi:hypothetical protein
MGYGKQGIEIKDSLTLRVPWHPETVVHRDSDRILSITPYELPEISLGTLVKVNSSPYRINRIDVVGAGSNIQYELSMAQRTKSSLFLLPMLPGLKRDYMTERVLINAFLATPDDTRCIALLYRFQGSKEFNRLETMLKGLPTFVSMHDVTKHTVLYVTSVPEECAEDYDLFVKGAYSKMSENFKQRVLRFHECGPESPMGQILYRSEKRKKTLESNLEVTLHPDAEVLSIPDIEKETYQPHIYDL